MYDTILRIAHDILVIGGALLMILSVVLMTILIVIAARVNHVVSKSIEMFALISQYVMLPFSYLASLFSKKEESSPDVKRKKASSKKEQE